MIGKNKMIVAAILAVIAVSGCRRSSSADHTSGIVMAPDYRDIVIPFNIAPLNFSLEGVEGKVEVSISGSLRDYRFKSKASRVVFPLSEWRSMLDGERGNRLRVIVTHGGSTIQEFYWDVSPDSIDKYLSYRLIEPAYEVWNLHSV